mmetsp:Transcript_21853/g.70360  ORF Transcript_21853/g.70360 Transcript_21853/m.70360 type:complete len:505 (-) Transcript_21853:715-2229(-)
MGRTGASSVASATPTLSTCFLRRGLGAALALGAGVASAPASALPDGPSRSTDSPSCPASASASVSAPASAPAPSVASPSPSAVGPSLLPSGSAPSVAVPSPSVASSFPASSAAAPSASAEPSADSASPPVAPAFAPASLSASAASSLDSAAAAGAGSASGSGATHSSTMTDVRATSISPRRSTATDSATLGVALRCRNGSVASARPVTCTRFTSGDAPAGSASVSSCVSVSVKSLVRDRLSRRLPAPSRGPNSTVDFSHMPSATAPSPSSPCAPSSAGPVSVARSPKRTGSCMNMGRTRKALEMLAARKAAPRAMASSPLRWTLSSVRPSSSFSSACTAGTRTLPPTISTSSSCSAVMPARASTSRTGPMARSSSGCAASSSSARVTSVWKSISSYRPSTVMGMASLADRISLSLEAAPRRRAMERGWERTSNSAGAPLAWRCALKRRASSCTMASSKWTPPSAGSAACAATEKVATVSSWPKWRVLRAPYSASSAWVAWPPML